MRRTTEWLDGIWRTQWTHPGEAHPRLTPRAPIPSNDFYFNERREFGVLFNSTHPQSNNSIIVPSH